MIGYDLNHDKERLNFDSLTLVATASKIATNSQTSQTLPMIQTHQQINETKEKTIFDNLRNQIDDITDLEKQVLHSLKNKSTLTDKIDSEEEAVLTLGQRVADQVAIFGGSWYFMISFAIFLAVWIALNVVWFRNQGFDPYPFILLNLLLSCLAAIQAPIIMMSQNRQEEKDRDRSKKDYMVNLKSELEIRMLHEKIDHLILHQQQEILELQKVQIELLNQILKMKQ